jgi:hypothetical protein
LDSWRKAEKRSVAPAHQDRHVLHSYFVGSPESPDGKYVLYYTSSAGNGESGDIRILERATGKETILASNITTEDAHRVACQQWTNGGKTVVFHDYRDGTWMVVAVDLENLRQRILARDRQLGFPAPEGVWIPVYGPHWNPGSHRDLELIHVGTGESRTPLTAARVVQEFGERLQEKYQTTDISICFPTMSPDEKRVFFKLSQPGGEDNFRSKKASKRFGKLIYDLEQNSFVRFMGEWGHPSWHPDSRHIFEKGNRMIDPTTGKERRPAPSAPSNHPTVNPDGRLFVTDADVSARPFGKSGEWAVIVGSMETDDFVVVDQFGNTQGPRSWRRNHPHPAFSADGKRIYYNVNDGPWARLMVAEVSDNAKKTTQTKESQ